jgi:Domain of unknown function (DUF4157)
MKDSGQQSKKFDPTSDNDKPVRLARKGKGNPRGPASEEAIHSSSQVSAAGNQALQRAVEASLTGRHLPVSQPGDANERQAEDQAADATSSSARPVPQGRPLGQATGPQAPTDLTTKLGPGQPLDAQSRASLEPRLAAKLGRVQVHTGGTADQAARTLRARAFAVGEDIAFASGQYDPHTTAGRRTLAHEVAHTVQQASVAVPLQIQRLTADERISNHTSWGNLDEAALGRELAALLPDGAADVEAVINSKQLGSTDKDDVALEIVKASSDTALKGAGDAFMRLLRAQLLSGWTSDDEYQAVGRLDQLIGGINGVEQSPSRPGSLDGTPKEIIDRFTTLNFLDEEGLGKALASRAVAQPDLLLSVLNALGPTDRDDVSEKIVNHLSVTDLASCSDNLLQRLRAELQGDALSYTADSEYQAIGRLDAAIRNRSLQMPLVGKAPPGATTFDEFVKMIEEIEKGFPEAEQRNTKLMITRVRKLFYGKKSWDEYLIPGAASVTPVYAPEEKEMSRRDIEIPYEPNLFQYVKTSYHLPGAPGKLQNPDEVQQVLMPDGSYEDLGHVFAGLDALNCPDGVSATFPWIGITKNVDAVTWVGDLGSVLAEAVLIIVENERQITPDEFQKVIDELAPGEDMLGDIDAYVIGQNADLDTKSTAGKKVSEILREYYLGEKSDRNQRYSIFAGQIGLGELKGNSFDAPSFGGEEAWLDYYEDEVNDSAALYLGASTDEKGSAWFIVNWIQRRSAALGLAMNAGSRDVLILFLRHLKAQIEKEGH